VSTTERAPFTTVWTALGLDGPRRDVSTAETITARTLASSTIAEPRPGPALVHDSTRQSAALPAAARATLPRISLAQPGEAAASPDRADAERDRRADLEILGTLGEGGMGIVHLARQRSLSREVAVKVLRPDAIDAGLADALLAEAVTMGFLEHPGILPVHLLGLDGAGLPILVMKRVDGVSWHDLLADPEGPAWAKLELSADRLGAHLEILMKVANALAFAHRRGVVHRDVKPANVMVGELGEVLLVDWGIATAIERVPAQNRPLRGTPAYMAPEMVFADGGLIDERTDVYLLGATLHEVLTGRPRHHGTTLRDVLASAYESAPFTYDASVPAELAAICNRATLPDQEDRYPSALAFRQALQDYLLHRGSIALAETASKLLEELRALLAAGSFEAERAHRLMTECRFGFMQALREWKDNTAAREGLEACLVAMIEHHLAEGSASAARGLARELPSPRPDLEQKIAALEEELRVRR
jgi:tRNA A-37 threonylcarbamoyl transferase component Bud32